MTSFYQTLLTLRDQILSWPDTIDDYAKGQDRYDVFQDLTQQLEQHLKTLETYHGYDKDDITKMLQEFQITMQSRYQETKQQIDCIREKMDNEKQYQTAAKAYGQY